MTCGSCCWMPCILPDLSWLILILDLVFGFRILLCLYNECSHLCQYRATSCSAAHFLCEWAKWLGPPPLPVIASNARLSYFWSSSDWQHCWLHSEHVSALPMPVQLARRHRMLERRSCRLRCRGCLIVFCRGTLWRRTKISRPLTCFMLWSSEVL